MSRRIRILVAFLSVVSMSSLPALSNAQTEFAKFEANPILGVGPPGSWDEANVVHPFVLFDGSLYRMWYQGGVSGAPAWEHGRIGYATSLDGVAWSKFSGNPVLSEGPPGSWDGAGVGRHSVVFDGTTYRMWYMGNRDGLQETNKIGLATSVDGVNWVKYSANPVISSSPWASAVADPYVVFTDGIYRMYFIGFSAGCGPSDPLVHWCTGLATSPDGINWNIHPTPVLTQGPEGSWDSSNLFKPVVKFDGSRWHMWYTGQPSIGGMPGGRFEIGYAYSVDGIAWTKSAGNPILTVGPSGRWDSVASWMGSIALDQSGSRIWYSGADTLISENHPTNFRIGLADQTTAFAWSFDDGNIAGWKPIVGWNSEAGQPEPPQDCRIVNGEYSLTTCHSLYRLRNFTDFIFEAQVRVVQATAEPIWGISFRQNPAAARYADIVAVTGDPYTLAQGYDLEFVGTMLYIFKCQETCTILASASPSIDRYSNHMLKVVAAGSDIRAFLNDVQVMHVTDSTFSEGLIGLFSIPNGCIASGCASVTSNFDNVKVTPLPSLSGSTVTFDGLETSVRTCILREQTIPIGEEVTTQFRSLGVIFEASSHALAEANRVSVTGGDSGFSGDPILAVDPTDGIDPCPLNGLVGENVTLTAIFVDPTTGLRSTAKNVGVHVSDGQLSVHVRTLDSRGNVLQDCLNIFSACPFVVAFSDPVPSCGRSCGLDLFFPGAEIARVQFIDEDASGNADGFTIDDFSFSIQRPTGCVAAPPGLVSWWPGDGNSEDVQNNNDGVLQNGASFGPGIVGQAFSLDGIDDYVLIGNPENLKISSGITIDAWVNPSATPPLDDSSLSGIYAIVTKWGQSAPTDAYGIWLHNPDDNIRLVGGIGVPSVSDGGIRNGGVVPVGQWSHVAMTYDGNTGINRLFVDGVLVGERIRIGGITVSDLSVLIGKEDSSLPRFFKGSIDEVEIYDRPLSPSEIAAIFEAGGSGKCKVSQTAITVEKFFTDSNLNPLPLDQFGNPKVDVVLANGMVRSINPGQVLAWVNVTNTGEVALRSLIVNETLPVDWLIHPPWLPPEGGIHAFFQFANGTRVEITNSTMITATTGNPQTVAMTIHDLTTTLGASSLGPGDSLLLSVKLSYALAGTSQSARSYPRNYTDTASVAAWTGATFAGSVATDTASGFFLAYARVVGDADGDLDIDVDDLISVHLQMFRSSFRHDMDLDGDVDLDDLVTTYLLQFTPIP